MGRRRRASLENGGRAGYSKRSRLDKLIRAFGPSAGLVDVKVIAFSQVLSGLKLVIPVAQRGS